MKTIKKAIVSIVSNIRVFFKGKRAKGFPPGNPPLPEGRIKTIEPIDPPLNMNIWYQQLRNKN